jgi:hypothetical protein
MPAFYNSMSENDIVTLVDATNRAYSNDAGIWAYVADDIGTFDFKLEYRGAKAAIASDEGSAVMPKLYRRLAAWAVNKKAKMVSGGFKAYLTSKKDDVCYDTEDYLRQGPAAQIHRLADFVEADGSVLAWPEQLVFKEAASELIVPGGGVPTW